MNYLPHISYVSFSLESFNSPISSFNSSTSSFRASFSSTLSIHFEHWTPSWVTGRKAGPIWLMRRALRHVGQFFWTPNQSVRQGWWNICPHLVITTSVWVNKAGLALPLEGPAALPAGGLTCEGRPRLLFAGGGLAGPGSPSRVCQQMTHSKSIFTELELRKIIFKNKKLIKAQI